MAREMMYGSGDEFHYAQCNHCSSLWLNYPPESTQAGAVLLVEFTVAGMNLVAINGRPMFTFTEAISLEILCEDQAEADHYWDALMADGGAHSQCGWLEDRHGLSWQVVPREATELLGEPDPAWAERAMHAMLQMQRLDVAALRTAYNVG